MRIIITDDESLARSRLHSLCDDIVGAVVVGEAANGKEALILSSKVKPDVVLLDIRMPGIDGIEAAMHLARYEDPPAVIFTTAYDDHALAAFEANAVDYLVKPVRSDRLKTALDRAQKLNRAQINAINFVEGSAKKRTHISARYRDTLYLVPVNEIIFFRAEQKYVNVYYDKNEILIDESLKQLESEFKDSFLRVHRNTLISMSFIQGLEKNPEGHYCVILKNTSERPEVSRRHVPDIKAAIKKIA